MTESDVTIDAFHTPVPGLVIHEAVNQPGSFWAVTHEASGSALSSYMPDPEAALACAVELGAFADFTGPLDHIAPQAWAACKKIQARWGAVAAPKHQIAPPRRLRRDSAGNDCCPEL